MIDTRVNKLINDIDDRCEGLTNIQLYTIQDIIEDWVVEDREETLTELVNIICDNIGERKYEITKLKGGYRYCTDEQKSNWDTLDNFEYLVNKSYNDLVENNAY